MAEKPVKESSIPLFGKREPNLQAGCEVGNKARVRRIGVNVDVGIPKDDGKNFIHL